MTRRQFDPLAIPVIVSGAPRSGTTFVTVSLNSHPQVMITNELRAWTLLNDLRRRTQAPTQLLPEHPAREAFKEFLFAGFGETFRNFYRSKVDDNILGCPAGRGNSVRRVVRAFGDKNPSYADKNHSGCLDYIAEAMPEARFIHVYRDPRSCIASYKAISVYSDDIAKCVDTWKRHVTGMTELRDSLGPNRVFNLKYEDYVTQTGEGVFRSLETFIGVDAAHEPIEFLRGEREAPVPYRSPSTPRQKLGQATFKDRLSTDEIYFIEKECEKMMVRLGYQLNQ